MVQARRCLFCIGAGIACVSAEDSPRSDGNGGMTAEETGPKKSYEGRGGVMVQRVWRTRRRAQHGVLVCCLCRDPGGPAAQPVDGKIAQFWKFCH